MTITDAIAISLFTSMWLLGTVGLIAWCLDGLVTERRLPWPRTLAALASTAAGLAIVIYLVAG